MVVFALAIWLFSLLLAGASLPTGARRTGLQGSGMADVRRIMGVLAPAGAAAGSAHIGAGAPACERAVVSRLNSTASARLPLIGDFTFRLRAGSQTRDWRFWAGKPADGCE